MYLSTLAINIIVRNYIIVVFSMKLCPEDGPWNILSSIYYIRSYCIVPVYLCYRNHSISLHLSIHDYGTSLSKWNDFRFKRSELKYWLVRLSHSLTDHPANWLRIWKPPSLWKKPLNIVLCLQISRRSVLLQRCKWPHHSLSLAPNSSWFVTQAPACIRCCPRHLHPVTTCQWVPGIPRRIHTCALLMLWKVAMTCAQIFTFEGECMVRGYVVSLHDTNTGSS